MKMPRPNETGTANRQDVERIRSYVEAHTEFPGAMDRVNASSFERTKLIQWIRQLLNYIDSA